MGGSFGELRVVVVWLVLVDTCLTRLQWVLKQSRNLFCQIISLKDPVLAADQRVSIFRVLQRFQLETLGQLVRFRVFGPSDFKSRLFSFGIHFNRFQFRVPCLGRFYGKLCNWIWDLLWLCD